MLSFGSRGGTSDMPSPSSRYRRLGVAIAALATIFLLLSALYVWTEEWSPRNVLPSVIPRPVTQSSQTKQTAAVSPFETTDAIKNSTVHYILPATSPNPLLCVVLSSLLANRYPIPTLLGWNGAGKYNATAAHFAKLYTMQRYLAELPHGGEDDDLVIFGDGHDVMAQLPVEVVVERYFEVRDEADKRLSDKYGLTPQEARAKGLRQTLFWGADKMCWPKLPDEAQCSVVPTSPLPHNSYGVKSGSDDWTYKPPRFLNSGSVIGPLGDLRTFINAGIQLMESTFDEGFKFRNSDQIYLARLYGKQELARAELLETRNMPADSETSDVQSKGESKSEYHVAVDHESIFVQPGCYTGHWRQKLRFNQPDNTAKVDQDLLSMKDFHAYFIQLHIAPCNVSTAPSPAPNDHTSQRASGSPHCPSKPTWSPAKSSLSTMPLAARRRSWQTLRSSGSIRGSASCSRLRHSVVKDGDILQEGTIIDGRRWVYKTAYPQDAEPGQSGKGEFGGVWTDDSEERYLPFKEICKDHMNILQS